MNRREALVALSTLFGGTIFGAHRLLANAVNALEGSSPRLFSDDDRRLLDELGETILPATPDSGGAKAANIGEFIHEIVHDFYTDEERATFTGGLRQLGVASRTEHAGRSFFELTPEERHALLLGFERSTPIPIFYQMLKQLTIWGYFSSKIGATEALAHLPIPGRFEGCVTIEPGTKAWAE